MQSIRVGESYEMGEILQTCFPSHTDTAGDEVVPLSSQIEFRKQFRVRIVLAIGQHSLDDLALSLPSGIVQMFFIQPLEYLLVGRCGIGQRTFGSVFFR